MLIGGVIHPSRLLLILALVTGSKPLPAQEIVTDGFELLIRTRIAMHAGATVGVVRWPVHGVRRFEFNADSVFHAASTMKVPVMIEYFRAIDEGRLARDATLRLGTEFKSIVDGSTYSLGPGVDSDSSVLDRVGQDVPLLWLVERMIVRSSNLATNALIELLDAKRVQATAHALGATSMKVLRGVEDTKAFQQGLNNQASPRDLAVLMHAIASGRAASAWSTQSMLDILTRQEFNDEIPAGLPPGTRVAHKTGWITGVLHDAAIVFPDGGLPYVLVVMSKGIADRAEARRLIADLARVLHGKE